MSTARRSRLLLVAFAFALAACAPAAGPAPTPDPATTIDQLASEALGQGITGAVVAVADPAGLRLLRAYGTADEAGMPLTPDAHYRIASVTKTFTADAVLVLAAEGRLSLDAPLATFVAGVPNGDRIRVRDLLAMRGGVYDFTDDQGFVARYEADPTLPGWRAEDLLPILAAHAAEARPPDTETRYSNSEYVLLGFVIERATGRPAAEALEARAAAHGLGQTTYPDRGDDLPAPFARGYISAADEQSRPPYRDGTVSNPAVPGTAGAMISSVPDMARHAVQLAGATDRQTWAPLTSSGIRLQYGLGVTQVGEWVGHDGSIFGYSDMVFHLPARGATVVVMVNAGNGAAVPAQELWIRIVDTLYPGTLTPLALTRPVLDPDALACHGSCVIHGVRASAATRTLRLALGWLVGAAVLVAAVEAVLLADSREAPYWALMLLPLTGIVYVVVGAVAWARRSRNRTGPILVAGGFVWFVAALVNTVEPVLIAAGQIIAWVPVAVIVHVLLAFPSGRLDTGRTRLLAAAGYLIAVLPQPVRYGTMPATPPYDPLLVADRPDVAYGVGVGQAVAAALLVGAVAGVLVHRLVVADRRRRRALAPVYAYGAVAVLGVAVLAALTRYVGVDPLVVPLIQLAVQAGVPVAFAAAMLRGGFARAGELEELAAWLARPARDGDLRGALVRALGDASLTLAFRVHRPEGPVGEWVDESGAPVELPAPGADRVAVPVVLGEREVAVVIHDRALLPDPEPVRAAGRIVALAADRERLTAELLASRDELRASRARLLHSGDRERRRLAGDLHDRLQSRLVLLAINASDASVAEAGSLAVVRQGIEEAITELRHLVQGVLPALLIERGLLAAVEDLAERSPLPVVLAADPQADEALPPEVESTVYHVVVEAVTNAVKHARATKVSVDVVRLGDRLRVEIADDGVGGAQVGGGAGLRGIADRAGALGGSVTLDSVEGRGTGLVLEVPCGS
ncbi:serine hydrolase [Actinomycetospora sp. OC33-EN08]|uniref:Serine hydrolase n=1 Tax=Actinomycetospora aurantiaca TaxID=3129233 RepID=A0ABU8MMF9_9PSEU